MYIYFHPVSRRVDGRCYNMRLRLALLWLGLLSCVLGLKDQVVSPYLPLSLVNKDAPLFSTSIGNYPDVTYPVETWNVRQWIFTTSLTNTDAYFGSVSDMDYGVNWSSGELYLYTGTPTRFATKAFPMAQWVYIVVGSAPGTVKFGIVTVRGETFVGTVLFMDQFKLQTTSTYLVSSNAISFTVSR